MAQPMRIGDISITGPIGQGLGVQLETPLFQVLEDNAGMNNALQRMGFTHYKTYRIYEREL